MAKARVIGSALTESQQILTGLSRSADNLMIAKSKALLQSKGITGYKPGSKKVSSEFTRDQEMPKGYVKLDDMDTGAYTQALRKAGLRLELTIDDIPEEYVTLGFKPVPGYDYAGNPSQIAKLVDPKHNKNSQQVLDAIDGNLQATQNLYTDPRSPIYRRIVGGETDPAKISRLIDGEIDRNRRFYLDWPKTREEFGGLEPDRILAMEAPLSRGSGPAGEAATRTQALQYPDRMLDAQYDPSVRSQYGNARSTYGWSSILPAIRYGVLGQNWRRAPQIFSSEADSVLKQGSYTVAKGFGDAPTMLPVGQVHGSTLAKRDFQLVQSVTVDRQAIAAGLGVRPIAPEKTISTQPAYNAWANIYRSRADARGVPVGQYQAELWYPIRELNNSESARLALGGVATPSPEAIKAFGGANDPKSYLEAARQSGRSKHQADLAAAGKNKELQNKAHRDYKDWTDGLQRIESEHSAKKYLTPTVSYGGPKSALGIVAAPLAAPTITEAFAQGPRPDLALGTGGREPETGRSTSFLDLAVNGPARTRPRRRGFLEQANYDPYIGGIA